MSNDYETMSDDDFANLEAPAPVSEVASDDVGDVAADTQADTAPEFDTLEDALNAAAEEQATSEEPAEAAEEASTDADDDAAEDGEEAAAPDDQEEEAVSEEPDSSEDDHTTPHQTESKESDAEAGEADDTPAEAASEDAQDYEQAYQNLMAPFRANGREIKLESPEEAKKLMQMGANYTKKMQALQPHLKLIRMLDNKGLLDQDKLSFLIDLDAKNPKAIQKLLHDGQIDPLDLDMSSDPAYTAGNHTVSDQEMAFHDALGDVTSTPTGQETVQLINSAWDQTSKEAVWASPDILRSINDQRANGIYDTISTEVERRKMLGKVPSELPFIHAYKQVGDDLQAQGRLIPKGSDGNPGNTTPAPRVLETRPAKRRKAVSNGDKAKAASTARSAPKSAPKPFDPINMSDEEFMAIPSP